MDRLNLYVFILLELALLVSTYLLSYITVYKHELVHKIIYETFGCNNTTINIKCDFFGCYGKTTASCNFPKDEEDRYYLMESLHLMNEIISYNLLSNYQLIPISTSILLFAMYILTQRRQP